MKLEPVEGDVFKQLRSRGPRGRVSYPILQMFLDSGYSAARLDREELDKSVTSLASTLSAGIKRHNFPIKVKTRAGEIYLVRTDTPEGMPDEAAVMDMNDWVDRPGGLS